MTFNKTQITIGSQTVDVFQNESGEYLYSLTAAAGLINKAAQTASNFVNSKAFKAKHGEAFQPLPFKDGNITYSLVPSEVISKFLIYWTAKGDNLAAITLEALTAESLNLRAARAFNQLSPASYDATVAKTNNHIEEWMTARLQTKGTHGPFQLSCKLKKQPATHVHNVITKGITGKTAADRRFSFDTNIAITEKTSCAANSSTRHRNIFETNRRRVVNLLFLVGMSEASKNVSMTSNAKQTKNQFSVFSQ